ncbi:MAG: glycosyl transferase [Bdellovibrionales bacterium RIFOXYD1_FULL_53_11]|nr:MAG: glycosyl transferase [Bdellovibrionales bacterium RIFOXYD1_FULL_53_11]
MRIALFSWETLHSIPVGGVGVHVTELGAALQRRGHEVHIFTRRGPGQNDYDNVLGVHYYRCNFPLHSSFVDEINNMCRAFAARFFGVEDTAGHFDIVHAHDWLAANAMVWIKQGRGHNTVLTMHSTEYGRNGNRFCGGSAPRVQDQERSATYWADKVIAVSSQLKGEVQWLYQLPEYKTRAIHNGVNAEAFDYEADTGEIKRRYGVAPLDPMVLFAGRLVVQKGPDILLRAIPGLLRHYGNTKFVFAGDGYMRGELGAMSHQLGISHAVKFLGVRGGRELTDLFKACDIVCVPSRNEPFGIVILEGWSAKKPVVSTKRGGPAEFVWHEITGLHVDDAPDSVGWGLGTLLADHERCRWMGRNGRAAVDAAFSWDRIAAQTEEVYSEVL